MSDTSSSDSRENQIRLQGGEKSRRQQPYSAVSMVVTHVVCHEHEHEEE